MKNEAEIIWWKTVKQDVETTPSRFTGAAARVEEAAAMGDESIFKRGYSLSAITNYTFIKLTFRLNKSIISNLETINIGTNKSVININRIILYFFIVNNCANNKLFTRIFL